MENSIISGEAFQELCDLIIITRYHEYIHTSLTKKVKRIYLDDVINENTIYQLNNNKKIFVYSSMLEQFINKLLPFIVNKFVLVTHNSDEPFDARYLNLVNDNRVLHVFAQNTFMLSPKLTSLPIGIANAMWPHGNKSNIVKMIQNKTPFENKLDKIYVNINVNTNKDRQKILDSLKNNELCYSSECNKSHLEYLSDIDKCKWVVCPKGNGVDCHRLWEVLYCGSIPICEYSTNTESFRYMGIPLISLRENQWDKLSLDFLKEETNKIFSNNIEQLEINWWAKMLDKY